MTKNYRATLQSVLMQRVATNPRYSLRAYARDLGLSPSYLSQVLNGSRGLTLKKSAQVFSRISVPTHDQKLFELEIQKEHLRTDKNKKQLQRLIEATLQEKEARTLPPSEFEAMSNWFAMVLLQIFYLKNAPLHSRARFRKFASQKLKVSESIVQKTLDTFVRLKLIAETRRGYQALQSTVWTTSGIPSSAIRSFHRQMIEKGGQAIELQEVNERILHSVQLPMKVERLEEMAQEVLKFRNHLLRKYSCASTEKQAADTVYGVNIQLFRLIEKD